MSQGEPSRKAFSIVVTNYNYGRFLGASVGSALRQDHPDFEVIVVDDASGDESLAILATFGSSIEVIAKRRNEGHAAAFNSGFALARGQIVLFLDADDYLYPTALAAIAASRKDGAAMYQWRLDLVDEKGTKLDTYPPPEARLDSGDVRSLLTGAGRYSTTVTSGMAFSRAALARVMPIEAKKFPRSGDGYLAAAAPFHGDVVEVSGIHGAYRQHGLNHSQFAQDLATRARWRLEHDRLRLEVIKAQARATGLTVSGDPLLGDHQHLQERLASLLFCPSSHPYPADRKSGLAWKGFLATARSSLDLKYRSALAAWWLAVLLLPARAAGALLSWRLFASSRPRWVDRSIRFVRAALAR